MINDLRHLPQKHEYLGPDPQKLGKPDMAQKLGKPDVVLHIYYPSKPMVRWVVERDAHRLAHLGNATVTSRTDPASYNVETRTMSGCLLTPRLT